MMPSFSVPVYDEEIDVVHIDGVKARIVKVVHEWPNTHPLNFLGFGGPEYVVKYTAHMTYEGQYRQARIDSPDDEDIKEAAEEFKQDINRFKEME